ncbi:MAG TPA: PspC domain-containing protein, partial [Ruminococcaceae bacterium]|nr:PspC domain-containing protein [Oscillospiraceae bacterium]
SRTDRKLAGVCIGIAAYFNVDSLIIRLLWIIFACFGGSGIIAYLAAAIVIPSDTDFPEN